MRIDQFLCHRRHLPGLALAAWPLWSRSEPAAPGQAVLWPTCKLLDGQSFGAAQTEGRAVVVVFWSTTCPFCRRHNQHVEKLHRAAAGKALNVLGVARDRDPAAVARYAREQGYSFPITMDYMAMAGALSTRNLIPLTVTVDRRGRLKQIFPGEMFEEDLLEMQQLASA
jgi:thiol-disulfide isomerase/thioredoxin